MPARSAKKAPGNPTVIPARRRQAQRSVALACRNSKEPLRLHLTQNKENLADYLALWSSLKDSLPDGSGRREAQRAADKPGQIRRARKQEGRRTTNVPAAPVSAGVGETTPSPRDLAWKGAISFIVMFLTGPPPAVIPVLKPSLPDKPHWPAQRSSCRFRSWSAGCLQRAERATKEWEFQRRSNFRRVVKQRDIQIVLRPFFMQ